MYERDMIGRYQAYENMILHMIENKMEKEGLNEAIDKQIKNDAYHDFQLQLNQIIRSSSAKYVYALYFKKNDKAMYYVLN